MWVNAGSVPPIIIGLAILVTSGAIAITWGERIEPRKAIIVSASLDRREKASTAPGLVVWSSSNTTCSGRPSTPFSFTASSAIFTPVCWKPPDSAAGPVIGTVMPTFNGSAARATYGIASVPAEASISVRRVIGTAILPGSPTGLGPVCSRAFQAHRTGLFKPSERHSRR